MKKKSLNKIITWHSLPKEAGEEEITLKEEETVILILVKEALCLLEVTGSYNNRN